MQSCSAGGRESPFLMDSGLPEISPKATKPTCSKGLTVLLEITFQRLSPKMCLDYFKSQLQACHRYTCLNILISHFSDFWGELGVKTCQGGVWAELYPRWLHVWGKSLNFPTPQANFPIYKMKGGFEQFLRSNPALDFMSLENKFSPYFVKQDNSCIVLETQLGNC